MNFSEALQALQGGACIRRMGWNSLQQFVYRVPGSTFKTQRAPLGTILGEGVEVSYNPHLDIFNTKTKTASTWVPSSADLEAVDWQVVKVEVNDGEISLVI